MDSPENVTEKVQELQETCNLNYLLVEFTHPGMPLEMTLRNLERFATHVMPRFADESGIKTGPVCFHERPSQKASLDCSTRVGGLGLIKSLSLELRLNQVPREDRNLAMENTNRQ